ncbi:MAG: septal ring lytic transglycosylase RlpA family protein [Asticcacaulis sp.]
MLAGMILLSACAGPKPKFNSGGVPDPKVASEPQYRPANLRAYTIRGKTYSPYIPRHGETQTGTATWYGHESGNLTATGERFIPEGISAAHKTWPLPSIIEVTNLDNGRSMRLRLNDRGPFVDDRILDLSKGAAKHLGMHDAGTARVRIRFIGPAEGGTPAGQVIASRPVADDDARYRVQIGAFSNRENAERARDMLNGRMERARGLYIVYLGPFKGTQQAELERQKAMSQGYFDAILTRAQ